MTLSVCEICQIKTFSMVMSYCQKPMERKFQKVKKKTDLPHPLPAFPQKSVVGPKMTKNGCSLSMFMSYTAGKPMDMERRF